jgi:hypothetical protein
VHTAFDVDARVDPGDVADRWNQEMSFGRVRREHADPRIVDGRV